MNGGKRSDKDDIKELNRYCEFYLLRDIDNECLPTYFSPSLITDSLSPKEIWGNSILKIWLVLT